MIFKHLNTFFNDPLPTSTPSLSYFFYLCTLLVILLWKLKNHISTGC